MFKRMSVLVRRPGDSRQAFSRGWEAHAAPVSSLPRVRGYIQNHVEEDLSAPGVSPIKVDGFVELLWDKPEDMAMAFASPQARPMVEDEPNFLGHGSGYALERAPALVEAQGGKLIVAVTGERPAVTAFEDRIAGLPGLERRIRDDVKTLIPKPGMAPPQPVDAFFHLYFTDESAARSAGEVLAAAGAPSLRTGVYRVRTIRFV